MLLLLLLFLLDEFTSRSGTTFQQAPTILLVKDEVVQLVEIEVR